MKQFIILLLLIILGFIVYDFYQDWTRFHPPGSNYKKSEKVDLNYHDPSVVYNYHNAIERLDAYVIQQWTVHDIDVRHPEDDDSATQLAVDKLNDLRAQVKHYEAILEQSLQWKNAGMTNQQISQKEIGDSRSTTTQITSKNDLLKQLYDSQITKSNRIGSKSALVYEIQKMLVKKGYDIPVDGFFKQITSTALADFETKTTYILTVC